MFVISTLALFDLKSYVAGNMKTFPRVGEHVSHIKNIIMTVNFDDGTSFIALFSLTRYSMKPVLLRGACFIDQENKISIHFCLFLLVANVLIVRIGMDSRAPGAPPNASADI